MNSKKWVISFLSLTLVTIIAFGATTYYLDPLLQYGKEPGRLTYREYTELYCNPGIAKNYDYDAVLVGSSMVENTDVNEIDKLFGCKTIKIPYSGASSYNHKHILDVCFRHNKSIKRIFWSLDEYALTTDKNTPRYPLPEYLYDDNKINDLSYLLNLDIFYFYTTKDVMATLKNQEQPVMPRTVMDWGKDESIFNTENALSSITYPMEEKENKKRDYYSKELNENLKYNVLPLIDNNPNIEFVFYMVPYSILYWYQEKQNGTLDASFYNVETAMGELLKRKNVKLFFFQDQKKIITDLDNYKDTTHFKPEYNSYMTKEMTKENCLLNKVNYKECINKFKEYLKNYNYDEFISSQIT